MIFNKQCAKYVYPVLEMINNKIKNLKMRKYKYKFENLIKDPEIRHELLSCSFWLLLRLLKDYGIVSSAALYLMKSDKSNSSYA